MTEVEVLARFVRETLGCGCPEAVLRQITSRPAPEAAARLGVHRVLDGGGRLVVLVVKARRLDEVAPVLAELTAAALRTRDEGGFNRVRLVVVAEEAARGSEVLGPAFERLRQGDDRLHLHVLEPHQLPDLGP